MPQTTLFSATLGEDGRTEPPLGPLYIAAALENIGLRLFSAIQQCPFRAANKESLNARCRTPIQVVRRV